MRPGAFAILSALVLLAGCSSAERQHEERQQVLGSVSDVVPVSGPAISREAALELARELGFQEGLSPWSAELKVHADYGPVWEIRNVLREASNERGGRTLIISAETGALVDSTMGWFELWEVPGPGRLHVEPVRPADAPN